MKRHREAVVVPVLERDDAKVDVYVVDAHILGQHALLIDRWLRQQLHNSLPVLVIARLHQLALGEIEFVDLALSV